MCYVLCGCEQLITKYQELWQEIMKLDSIRHFDVIYLDCEDLKNSLASSAYKLSQMLLDKVAQDHREENKRYISNFFCTSLKFVLCSKSASCSGICFRHVAARISAVKPESIRC